MSRHDEHEHEHGHLREHGHLPGHEHEHEHEHGNGPHHHLHDHEGHHHHGHERDHPHRRALGTTGYVDCTTHDEASVASAVGTIALPLDEARVRMRGAFEQIGAWVDANQGIIGHIKCSLTMQHMVSLSLTLDEVQEKESLIPGASFTMAAIVFGIEPTELRDHVAQELAGIVA